MRFSGETGERPIGDIDALVLGSPDRDDLYAAIAAAEQRLGRPVHVTVRAAGWVDTGTGNFHATVTERPLVAIPSGRAAVSLGEHDVRSPGELGLMCTRSDPRSTRCWPAHPPSPSRPTRTCFRCCSAIRCRT